MPKLDSTKLPKAIKDKYTLLNSALVQAVKTDWRDSISAEIGDTKDATTFQPQVKICRWLNSDGTNEVNFSMRLKHTEKNPTVEFDGEKTKWIGAKVEAHFYDKPEVSEDGGHEFEVILKEKPKTNILEFSIETKGLEFFYQSALTESEIAEGANRPENVIDSYAVYYKDCPANYVDGKLYRTGKAFHIYRIKATDANGVSVWGKQNIDVDKKLHTIELPQDFLDKAVYPVVIDPTFGYTTQGASYVSTTADVLYGQVYSGAAGTGNSMSLYCQRIYNPPLLELGLYDNSENFVQKTNATSYTGTLEWATLTFVSEPTLTAQNYYLCFNRGVGDLTYYDSGGTYYIPSVSHGTWPSSVDFTSSQSGNSRIWSIYATYTAGGGTDVTVAVGLESVTTSNYSPSGIGSSLLALALESIALSSFAPSILGSAKLATSLQSLTASVYGPTLLGGSLVSVALRSLTASVFDPAILGGSLLSVALKTMPASIFSPIEIAGSLLSVGLETIAASVYSPTEKTGALLSVALETITASVFDPTIITGARFSVGLETITAAVFDPSIATQGNITVTVNLQTLTASIFDPSILGGSILSIGMKTISASVFSPSSLGGSLSLAGLQTLTASIFDPTIILAGGVLVSLNLQTLIASIYDPAICWGSTITVGLQGLTAAVFDPTVTTGGGTYGGTLKVYVSSSWKKGKQHTCVGGVFN
jgi:hypothetical protein